MAIKLNASYPGQTTPASATYPWGAAQNIAAPGDTNGLPLEADWINDIFGFGAALLTAGNVTPDGDPDTALDSQYLAAMRNVINAEIGTANDNVPFVAANYAWGGQHSFARPIQGDLKLTGEVLYPELRQRRMMLPLEAFRPVLHHENNLPGTTDWKFFEDVSGISTWSSSGPDDVLVGRFRLPVGARAVGLRAWVDLDGSASLTITVSRQRYPTAVGAEGQYGVLQALQDFPLSVGAPWHTTVGDFLDVDQQHPFDSESDLLRVRLKTGTGSGTVQFSWIELVYAEPGPHY